MCRFGIEFQRGAALASVREQRQLNIKTLSASSVCLKMKWKPTTTAAAAAQQAAQLTSTAATTTAATMVTATVAAVAAVAACCCCHLFCTLCESLLPIRLED